MTLSVFLRRSPFIVLVLAVGAMLSQAAAPLSLKPAGAGAGSVLAQGAALSPKRERGLQSGPGSNPLLQNPVPTDLPLPVLPASVNPSVNTPTPVNQS
ncbi:hypothetical protein INR49_008993 [Caranx melampygus]|nr:hypothetical protein INR49_008993 [Caranx melampygus]